MNFEERLIFILDGRKKTPWGKALTFTSPSITAMFNGHVPGPEFLSTISAVENVNLNWLLNGIGSPFIVEPFLNAEEFQAFLLKELTENWEFHILSLGSMSLIIMSQLSEIEFKGSELPFRQVKVLVGNGSEDLAQLLRNKVSRERVKTVKLENEEIESVVAGRMGTYQLFAKSPSLLTDAEVASDEDLQFYPDVSHHSEAINLLLMRDLINEIEKYSVDLSLSADQKARIISAVYQQLLQNKSLTDDLMKRMVKMAVNVVFD